MNEPRSPAAPDAAARRVLWVVASGTFISALAGSMVNLALPALGTDLGLSVENVAWVVQAYLLAATLLLLLAGRLGDAWGHRRIYLGGYLLFTVASLACGLAGSFGVLVAARGLQGVGAAAVMATGPALLTTSRPAARRGHALGIVSTATYSGLSVGPTLGGLVLAAGGWRWIFLLQAPVAVVVLILGWRFLPREGQRRAHRLDLPGLLLLGLGLPALLVALTRGNDWGWATPRTLGGLAAGIGLLAIFVAVELRRREPLLDVGLFRSPVFTGASLSAIFNYAALFIPMILLPFYLIEGLGLHEAGTGLVLSVQPVVMALVASPAGSLSDRLGTRVLAVTGMGVLAVGLLGLATLGSGAGAVTVSAWMAVVGLGTGIFISPNSSALMGAAPGARQGIAGGVLAMSRTLGMTLGVAAAAALFELAGGRTGGAWAPINDRALQVALLVAAGVALAGAAASALRPAPEESLR